MKPHSEMFVVAEHCPECGVVPMHEGHFCASRIDCCPMCGDIIRDRHHWEFCKQCPLCVSCCFEMDAKWNRALMIALGFLPFEGTDEHDICYVAKMRTEVKAMPDTKERRRRREELTEFIFSQQLADERKARRQ